MPRAKPSLGGSKRPYYPGTPEQEALKQIRLMAQRVLDERATRSDLAAAYHHWLEIVSTVSAPPDDSTED